MQPEEVPPAENNRPEVNEEEHDNDTERQPGLADVMANLEQELAEKEKEIVNPTPPPENANENEENQALTDAGKTGVPLVTPVQLIEADQEHEGINNHRSLLESEGETEVAQPKVIKNSPRTPKENEPDNDTEK